MGKTNTYRLELPKKRGFNVYTLPEDVWYQPDNVIKSRGGRKQYDLAPGWYREQRVEVLEITCQGCEHSGGCGEIMHVRQKTSTYFAISDLGEYRPVSSADLEHVATMVRGPVPGANGAWNSSTCRCGAEVAEYDSRGFPWCEDHAQAASSDVAPELVSF